MYPSRDSFVHVVSVRRDIESQRSGPSAIITLTVHFMSLLIRVELPTYSHSFQISVPSIGTIDDVKREIERVCTGNPRVHGQRLIWRGRFLGDDEKVLDIWKVRRVPQPTRSFCS
jgi:hypothetical protein